MHLSVMLNKNPDYREEIYKSFVCHGLFQKGCRRRTRERNDQLYRDQHISKEAKMRQNTIAMACIGYKKVNYRILQTCITDCLKINEISDKIINIIKNYMKNLWIELIACGQTIAEIKIQRGISPGRLTLATAMHNINDAIQLHAKEVHYSLQIY